MKIKLLIIPICTAILVTGCDKDDEIVEEKRTATQLLTSKNWVITAAGFDDNKNGLIDVSENTLAECHTDNTYTFDPSGSGSISDNARVCDNPVNADFVWSFEENETRLKINTESSFILRLDERELVLKMDWPWLTADFMMVYGH